MGRQHIIPAQVQTFINPIISLPVYLLIAYLPPISVGFLLGLVQGLNFALVYLLARQLLSGTHFDFMTSAMRNMIPLIAAIIGVTAPMFVSEIGATFGDNFTSIFVLAALLLVLRKPSQHLCLYPVIGGFLIGIAAGLKLTNMIFLLALIGCGWWYEYRFRRAITAILLFLIGASLALFVFQGYWSWHLFR